MTVWNTITNMGTLDASLGSFFQVLGDEIGAQNCWRLKDVHDEATLATSNEWCYYAYYVRYSLLRIQRGAERYRGPGNLTIGVELWREVTNQENIWEYAKQPLIYVGFSPRRRDYWSDDMALDFQGAPKWYPDGDVACPTDDAPYLWTWRGEGEDRWSLRDWFFVLPLCSIERREDIQNEIIAPLRSLLHDNYDPNTAFSGRRALSTIATICQ